MNARHITPTLMIPQLSACTSETAYVWSWVEITIGALFSVLAIGVVWTALIWSGRRLGALTRTQAQHLHHIGQVAFGLAILIATLFPYMLTRAPGLAIGTGALLLVLTMAHRSTQAAERDLRESA